MVLVDCDTRAEAVLKSPLWSTNTNLGLPIRNRNSTISQFVCFFKCCLNGRFLSVWIVFWGNPYDWTLPQFEGTGFQQSDYQLLNRVGLAGWKRKAIRTLHDAAWRGLGSRLGAPGDFLFSQIMTFCFRFCGLFLMQVFVCHPFSFPSCRRSGCNQWLSRDFAYGFY